MAHPSISSITVSFTIQKSRINVNEQILTLSWITEKDLTDPSGSCTAPIMEQKRMATILGDVKMEGSKVDRHFVVALHMGAECRNRKNVKTLADQHAAKHLLVKRCEKD